MATRADVSAEILKNASHLKCHRDDVVVRQGDIGENFYIILSGSVSVYITSKPKDNEKVTPRRGDEELLTDKTNIPDEIMDSEKIPKKKTKKKDELNRSKFGQHVVVLGDRQSFGELALIFGDRKRNASIIVDGETDLLVVSYDLFNKTIKEHAEKDLEKKMSFIQTHPFFSKWSPEMQRMLQVSLKRSSYGIGGQVVKQGQPVTGLHFLIHGRARLTTEPSRHAHQFEDVMGPGSTDWKTAAAAPVHTFKPQLTPLQKQPTFDRMATFTQRQPTFVHMATFTQIKRSDGYAAAEKIVFEKKCDLCAVAEGEVLDDLEIVLGLETHIFTVTCITKCEVYSLSTKLYERLVLKKNPYTLNIIKLLSETKLKSRMSSNRGKKISLLPHLLLQLNNIRVLNVPEGGGVKDLRRIEEVPAPHLNRSKTHVNLKADNISANFELLKKWYLKDRTPFIQPVTTGGLYYREMILRKAKLRLIERKRLNLNKGDGDYRSLDRKIKDSFITGLKEAIKVQNTLRRVSLMKSITEEHWR
ncbi:hypothetical protein ScPMuIL_016326 [Solemya velum]